MDSILIKDIELQIYGDRIHVGCSCGPYSSGKVFCIRLWERGPEKMVQRAIRHVLHHKQREQQARDATHYAKDYAQALVETTEGL